jgi:hypothetical protein
MSSATAAAGSRPPAAESIREGAFSALAGAALFAAGATLALVAVALPPPAEVDERGIAFTAAAAYAAPR